MSNIIVGRFNEGAMRLRNRELINEFTESRKSLWEQLISIEEEITITGDELELTPWFNLDDDIEE